MAKRLPKYCKQSPKKDPQRNLVYFMEGDSFGALQGRARMTRAAIRAFAKKVCRNYKLPQVNVQFSKINDCAANWVEPRTIVFNPKVPWSHGLLVVVHELAHHLHFSICPTGHQDHGPEFMCCYMDILDTTRTVPLVGMRAVCDSYGVKYADRGKDNSLKALKKAVLGYSR